MPDFGGRRGRCVLRLSGNGDLPDPPLVCLGLRGLPGFDGDERLPRLDAGGVIIHCQAVHCGLKPVGGNPRRRLG